MPYHINVIVSFVFCRVCIKSLRIPTKWLYKRPPFCFFIPHYHTYSTANFQLWMGKWKIAIGQWKKKITKKMQKKVFCWACMLNTKCYTVYDSTAICSRWINWVTGAFYETVIFIIQRTVKDDLLDLCLNTTNNSLVISA